MVTPDKVQQQIVPASASSSERKIIPAARGFERRDEYPHEVVEEMKEMGLFECNVPTRRIGPELHHLRDDHRRAVARVDERIGPICTHSVICDIINSFGTGEQKREYLPGLASGERRRSWRSPKPTPAPTCSESAPWRPAWRGAI